MLSFPSLIVVAGLTANGSGPAGTATVPLEELLPLYAGAQSPTAHPPPVDALVVRSELKGRLAPDALNIDAHFEVNVLADRWTRVALLELGPEVFLRETPSLESATVASHQHQLCLLTNRAGTYKFDVGLTVRAAVSATQRRAQLALGPQGLAVSLKLEADPAVFTVLEPRAAAEVQEVYPSQGHWVVAWQNTTLQRDAKPTVRPPLEPTIARADASWVSTLEGRASVRMQYELRLDREQELLLTIPEGQRLERATVNGVAVAAVPEGNQLRLAVAPASVGGSEAKVSVTLAQDLGVFHLSGLLKFALPQASWPIAEVSAQAHLPAVFNYRRQGGSLEQTEHAEPEAQSGLPGKALSFRQFLVSASSPTLELGYSVDMSKSYFR